MTAPYLGHHLCDYCLRYTQNKIFFDNIGTHLDCHPCTFVNRYYNNDDMGHLFNEKDFIWEFGTHYQNDRTIRPLNDPDHILLKTVDMGSGFNVLVCEGFANDYKEYLKSEEWKEKKMKRIEHDKYRCKLCGSGKNLQVHHITYENFPNETIDDLVTVCRNCHIEIHEKDNLQK